MFFNKQTIKPVKIIKLQPKYQLKIDKSWLLWFKQSNSYLIVDSNFKKLLSLFFNSKSEENFKNLFIKELQNDYPNNLYQEVLCFLKEKNKKKQKIIVEEKKLIHSKVKLSETYSFNARTFKINYDTEQNKKLIHASLKHLVEKFETSANDVFDITSDKNFYYLFKNKKLIRSCKLNEFHLLQGKLILLIFNTIYQKKENDWVATFHASTVSNGKEAIMCVGYSGKGKSTLTALMISEGYELVADDISPILQEDLHIYKNPSAVSIKEGAFKLLNTKFKDFETADTFFVNDSKGTVKYLPPYKHSTNNSYKCKKVVLVNYSPTSKYNLEKISAEKALHILIPESWISPKKRNAKSFLKWIKSCSFYELTYNQTSEAKNAFEKLFKN